MKRTAGRETQRIERRDHFRGRPRGRRLEIRFGVLGEPGRTPRAAETYDIGIGGAFICCADPPAVGARIAIEAWIVPKGPPLALRGEVRWVGASAERTGMGVRFEALDVEALLALSEYFASLTAP